MITGTEFKSALEQALQRSGPFARVLSELNATYRLNVFIFSQNHPVTGLALTSELSTIWTLVRAETNETVWKDGVQSKYTASYGDAFAGVKRMRLAAEGAARENIQAGMSKLATVHLD